MRITLALLTLALALFSTQAESSEDAAATIIVPDGGRVVQQGERLDIYDAKSKRVGYGIQRGDGSTDIYNVDGSRKATITPGIGGQLGRITVPKGKR